MSERGWDTGQTQAQEEKVLAQRARPGVCHAHTPGSRAWVSGTMQVTPMGRGTRAMEQGRRERQHEDNGCLLLECSAEPCGMHLPDVLSNQRRNPFPTDSYLISPHMSVVHV